MSSVDEADSTPTVTVRGDGLIRAEPDEAVLWITLTALEDRPGTALADVSARATALVALLDEVGVSEGDRSTTGIAVGEEFDHTPEGRVSVGHRAASGVSVRLSDPELIGRLISRATQELDARIGGPRWLISLDNPVRLEAARRAAADARRKAEAYAEGVGAKVGRLIRLSEPGEHAGHAIRMARSAGGGQHHDSIPVEPGEHEVAASIQATFALELS
jgi:uncharacterized protein YggE